MINKKILIIVTGSIAAYKTCEVIRILRKEGSDVKVMMTESAQRFIGKTTFSALTNHEIVTEIFTETPKAGLEHIEMAIELDAIVVIPATANILCKVANGIADEVASTTLSVCEQPTLFVPAMNNRMWYNPATMKSVSLLRKRGKVVLNPEKGQLASLHEGDGRLPQIQDIMNSIRCLFNKQLLLKNKTILVTAGPTREKIDPVRYISNRSSGKMGYAIAEKARDMGAKVILISGPVSISPIPEVKMIFVESSKEMHEAVEQYCSNIDYLFMVAAVTDYYPQNPETQKIKRNSRMRLLSLKPSVDILKTIKVKKDTIITAFALETHNGEIEAVRKMQDKNADYIVLNYANEEGAGFDSNTNRVIVFSKSGERFNIEFDRKDRIAEKLLKYILDN